MRPQHHSALPLISASQISTWRDCQRKWAWAYIAGIRSPSTASQALGTEVHDTQLGPYLIEGRPFDFTRDSGYIANALLEYLPQAKTPGMVIEKHFVLPSPASEGRFAFQGYMDLWLPPICDEHEDCREHPELGLACAKSQRLVPDIIDFKTTSDLKWAKSPAQLGIDPQAMLYATNALFETGAAHVDLSWLYTQTRGARRAKRTYLRVGEDHVIEQFRGIEETALELFDAKQHVKDPLELPPSPSQCEAYGGCPHRDKCNLSPSDHLMALGSRVFAPIGGMSMSEGIGNGTSSLLANLKARKAGAQPASSAATTPDSAGLTPAEAAPAPSPPASTEPVALGINPPEKDLPPPETAKRGPGRPRKPKPEATAALVADPRQAELPLVPQEEAPPAAVTPVLALSDISYDKLAILIVDQLITRIARLRGVE